MTRAAKKLHLIALSALCGLPVLFAPLTAAAYVYRYHPGAAAVVVDPEQLGELLPPGETQPAAPNQPMAALPPAAVEAAPAAEDQPAAKKLQRPFFSSVPARPAAPVAAAPMQQPYYQPPRQALQPPVAPVAPPQNPVMAAPVPVPMTVPSPAPALSSTASPSLVSDENAKAAAQAIDKSFESLLSDVGRPAPPAVAAPAAPPAPAPVAVQRPAPPAVIEKYVVTEKIIRDIPPVPTPKAAQEKISAPVAPMPAPAPPPVVAAPKPAAVSTPVAAPVVAAPEKPVTPPPAPVAAAEEPKKEVAPSVTHATEMPAPLSIAEDAHKDISAPLPQKEEPEQPAPAAKTAAEELKDAVAAEEPVTPAVAAEEKKTAPVDITKEETAAREKPAVEEVTPETAPKEEPVAAEAEAAPAAEPHADIVWDEKPAAEYTAAAETPDPSLPDVTSEVERPTEMASATPVPSQAVHENDAAVDELASNLKAEAETKPVPKEETTEKTAEAYSKQEEPAAETAAAAPSADDLSVEFESRSSSLSDAAAKKLDDLSRQMLDAPEMRVQIRAYAKGDDSGESSARRMSLSRALIVRSYLMDKGIKATRLDVRALGTETDRMPIDRADLVFTR